MTQRIEEATASPVNERFGADLDRLLQPANHFSHPLKVVGDQTLSLIEKRAILASWASDACAVDSMPALRQMPGSPAPVAFDAVMDALRQLDGGHHERPSQLFRWRGRRQRAAGAEDRFPPG